MPELAMEINLKLFFYARRTLRSNSDGGPSKILSRATLRLGIQRKVNREMKSYCSSESVLKATEPDQLAGFSSKIVVAVRAYCPLWHACLTGAAGVKDKRFTQNKLALATSVVVRDRNQKMSVVAYRISSLLVHSGATMQDITRLNKLGVCMAPKSTLRMQRKMVEFFDVKVLKWKSTIEETKRNINLLKDTLQHQKPNDLSEDCMDLEFNVDFSEEVVKCYDSYTPEGDSQLKSSLEKHPHFNRVSTCSEELLVEEIVNLERQKLPLYKLVADNLDLEVVSLIQSKGKDNRSIHWTHQFALLDRASPAAEDLGTPASPLSESDQSSSQMQFIQLLPDAQVQENLLNRMAVLVSRVLTKYLKASPFSRIQ